MMENNPVQGDAVVRDNEVQGVSLPRIGDPAPQFEAVTSHGTVKLDDYKGKWLVIFSHPADFTPVCTTEFMGFQGKYDTFKKMNTELLGLSIDSVHSHIAWVRNIEEKFGVKIEFPIIADLDTAVATKYGMIMPEANTTETSRAVFVIDPEQTVRAIVYYPLSTGRNMDEMVRLVQSLQTVDKNGVATPADWQEGDKVIVPPASTQQQAEERMTDTSIECTDWYICKKNV